MRTVAELAVLRVSIARAEPTDIRVNLYCWPCRMVHELALPDVEQIVYALGAEAITAAAADPVEADTPACLREVLLVANSPEVFLEHVEQGIECREKTPEPEVPYVRPAPADADWPDVVRTRLPGGPTLDAERAGRASAAQPEVWRQGGSSDRGLTIYQGPRLVGMVTFPTTAEFIVRVMNEGIPPGPRRQRSVGPWWVDNDRVLRCWWEPRALVAESEDARSISRVLNCLVARVGES